MSNTWEILSESLEKHLVETLDLEESFQEQEESLEEYLQEGVWGNLE